MKKKLIISFAMILSFGYGMVSGVYKIFPFEEVQTVKKFITGEKPSYKYFPYYYDKASFFEMYSRDSYDVVFIGDSITDGAEWSDIYQNLVIANRGIGGDTTEGVLKRIDPILKTKAKVAFLMIGTNDIWMGISNDEIMNNYKKIIENLSDAKIKSIVQSTLLTNNIARPNEIIDDLNKRLKIYCSENNITFIDLNEHLSLSGVLNSAYTNDGIHLNAKGYKVWSEVLNNYIP